MNLVIKSTLLDAVMSIVFTLAGGGNFYSFLFFFVLLFLPAVLVFISLDIVTKSSKNSSVAGAGKKDSIE